MRLDNFDLNLLVALDALLAERNVTRAAERLNVTQSAMSASLRRLREALQDDLLVQVGRRMVPTAQALELAPRVSAALLQLRGLISSSTGFDPATSNRRFVIAASDYIATVLLTPLMRDFEQAAPGLRLDIVLPSERTPGLLDRGEYDLMLTPHEFMAEGHPAELVFEERQVVVGWSDNPILQQPLDLPTFINARHVGVRIDGRKTFVERALEQTGLSLNEELIAPSFIQVPHFLPGTGRIALMHERLARHMARILPLTLAEPPLAITPMQEMAQYHAARTGDTGLHWLLGKIHEQARRV